MTFEEMVERTATWVEAEDWGELVVNGDAVAEGVLKEAGVPELLEENERLRGDTCWYCKGQRTFGSTAQGRGVGGQTITPCGVCEGTGQGTAARANERAERAEARLAEAESDAQAWHDQWDRVLDERNELQARLAEAGRFLAEKLEDDGLCDHEPVDAAYCWWCQVRAFLDREEADVASGEAGLSDDLDRLEQD